MNDLTGKRRGARNRVQELRDSILDGTIGLTMEDVQDVVGELRDSILDGTIGLTPEGVQDVVGVMIVGAGGAYDDAAGTITLPAGPPGNPSAYELRGAGMPNGVVTASPGTYYTDTVGTNGAWRWLKKSGNGNTGWDVAHGDTGWRRLLRKSEGSSHTLTPAFSAAAGSFIDIRRVGTEVMLRLIGSLTATGGVAAQRPVFVEALPAGFLSYYNLGVMRTSTPLGQAAFGPVIGGSTLVADCPAATTVFGYGTARWETNDAWPTTLPGIPV